VLAKTPISGCGVLQYRSCVRCGLRVRRRSTMQSFTVQLSVAAPVFCLTQLACGMLL
jgi:hypothetical protein